MSVKKRFAGGKLIEHLIDGIAQPIDLEHRSWPMALISLKLLAKEGDRGAGDIIARMIGPIGGDAFKKWYRAIFGKSCGCGARQEILNARWPLT